MGVPEERKPRRELVDVEPRLLRRPHVRQAVGERERHLLGGRGAGLANVVAADRDRVPRRQLVAAVREEVGDQPHRRLRRVDVGAAGRVLLEDVVLDRAPDQPGGHALFLRHQLVQQQEDRRGGVDRHRRGDLREGDAGEQAPHVVDGVDGDADLAHLPGGASVVRVEAHLGGEVEGHREAGLAGVEQGPEAGVGLLGGAEAGVLAHGPEAAAVHLGMESARVGVLAGVAVAARILVGGGVLGPVEALQPDAGGCGTRLLHGRRLDRWLGHAPIIGSGSQRRPVAPGRGAREGVVARARLGVRALRGDPEM